MHRTSKRAAKVAELIQHQLANLIRKEVADPRLRTLTITMVEVSPDLGTADVYYTLLESANEPQAQKALVKATGFLRHGLSQTTALRYVPKLIFHYDLAIERAEKMVKLLGDINPTDDE